MVQNEILLEASSKQNKFSIGRSNRRDVELKLKAVSADHCKIEYSKEKGWYIHEQGKDRLSSNGTFVFMKSHQQMEDHEPSDLIPLFNGMIISFINYELQVRIEPKLTQELAQANQAAIDNNFRTLTMRADAKAGADNAHHDRNGKGSTHGSRSSRTHGTADLLFRIWDATR
jgi:pSer/pThr/pTyr-binding forkhead associated (FHA) protein